MRGRLVMGLFSFWSVWIQSISLAVVLSLNVLLGWLEVLRWLSSLSCREELVQQVWAARLHTAFVCVAPCSALLLLPVGFLIPYLGSSFYICQTKTTREETRRLKNRSAFGAQALKNTKETRPWIIGVGKTCLGGISSVQDNKSCCSLWNDGCFLVKWQLLTSGRHCDISFHLSSTK